MAIPLTRFFAKQKSEARSSRLRKKLTLLTPESVIGFEELAERYIKAGAIPEKKLPDARHIAIATIAGMDILVSWNQRHIVRYKTQSIINAINEEHNLSPIAINTPAEIISYEESNAAN